MRRFFVVLLSAATVGVIPATAVATPTPSSGVSGTVLSQGTSTETIKVKNNGATDVVLRHVVIEPGGSTGWHYHPGDLIAVIHKGTLSQTLQDCTVTTATAGQSFVERGGEEHVHTGRNEGDEPVEIYVTYVIPAGAPLAIDAPDPGC